MRTAILASSEGWHVRDLRRAAAELGLGVERLDFRDLKGSAGCDQAFPFDAVIVRTMPSGSLEQVIFRMDVLGLLEASGVRVVNPPRALETAIDKYLGSARMASVGLPVPRTIVCERSAKGLEAFEELGGDVVLKPLFGSEGKGLERLTSRADATASFARLEAEGKVILAQRFVKHPGHDYRLFVLGGKVIAAMRRVAVRGWITNVAQGGRPERVETTGELELLALRAAAAIGAQVAGVDILPDLEGRLWVLEVNAVPGWKALAPTTGLDVARAVLEWTVTPAVDIPPAAL